MTLLITVIAAVISTLCWYLTARRIDLKLEVLCCLFWGASIMWLVDAVFAYQEEGVAIFAPGMDLLINDTFLGLCVIALALVIWIVCLLWTDPEGVLTEKLIERKKKKCQEEVTKESN